MNTITATNARQNWAKTIEDAKSEPVLLTDHGRPTVVVMSAELARLALQVLEDARDTEEGMKALEEVQAGGKTFSLEEVAAELGLELAKR